MGTDLGGIDDEAEGRNAGAVLVDADAVVEHVERADLQENRVPLASVGWGSVPGATLVEISGAARKTTGPLASSMPSPLTNVGVGVRSWPE